MYDIKWLTLPNRMLYPVLCLIVLQVVITLIFYGGGLHYLVGDLLGLLIGGGIFFVLFQLSRGKWIGGGDVKLGALLGLYLGSATDAILMIFFASVIGSMYSVPMIGSGKTTRKTLIPYGPFLITAAIILRLFGSSINTWLNTKGLRV
jgi:prepilin signal peptidase PulO-like enzyme (type II secretory pathway)